MEKGRVLERTKSFYYVEVSQCVHLCRIKGNLFEDSAYDKRIAVGDWVNVDLSASDDAGWIHEVETRTSQIVRPHKGRDIAQVLVSNVDLLLMVNALKKPSFRYGFVDRFLIVAQKGNIAPVIILNKTDLGKASQIQEIRSVYEPLEIPILETSTKLPQGLPELADYLSHKTTALAGYSGVGKSSLLKALFPEWDIRVGDVSQGSGKGKHTTTSAKMHPLPNHQGYVVDTPGIRSLGLFQVDADELDDYFEEFKQHRSQCYFKGCSHRHEPQCAIQEAVKAGQIAESRYQSYCDIYESLLTP